jgi:hypothetical protein
VFGQTESSITDTRVVEASDITPAAGTRYIYYRLYTEDESIPSANPIYSNDPSLGRISANVVTPPHTAINLKRCLLALENIDASISTSLFITASTQEPLDDKARVLILKSPGPGCTPNEPMALVAKVFGADRSALELKKPKPKPRDSKYFFNRSGLYSRSRSTQQSRHSVAHLETHYLYYRVYNKDSGALPLHYLAGSDDPSVGRISLNSIPPPHSTASIMRRITKIEKLGCTGESQLFRNISSESPLGEGHISILTSDRPGSTPEDPMAFVASIHSKFPQRIRVIYSWKSGSGNPRWLTINAGEILRAHDLVPQHPWVGSNGSVTLFDAYKAVNKAGIEGFVPTNTPQIFFNGCNRQLIARISYTHQFIRIFGMIYYCMRVSTCQQDVKLDAGF